MWWCCGTVDSLMLQSLVQCLVVAVPCAAVSDVVAGNAYQDMHDETD